MENPLTVLSIDELRERRSVKWRMHGPDVLPLWVAEMDTPLPAHVSDALAAAVRRGDTGYAHPGRFPEAFAGFASRRFGWTPDPTRKVVVPDVIRGVAEVVKVVSKPGDGVLINTPVYPPFFTFVAATGRRIVESPLARAENGAYSLDTDALDRDLARPDVAVYLLCNPHNPTGLTLRPDELADVSRLAERHGVRILADEVHAPLTYPGVSHTPLASVPGGGASASIVFSSASKAWNVAGLKAALAIAGGDEGWAALSRLPAEVSFGTGLLGVIAGEAAFAGDDEWLAALMAGLDRNRRLLADLLAENLPGVRYVMPDATYLAWLDFSGLDLGDDPAAWLLERARVALSNGPAFGDLGRGHARLNLAASPDLLAEAVRRMADAVASAR